MPKIFALDAWAASPMENGRSENSADQCRGEEFNNHWHVKAALLKEILTTGVRLYNYLDMESGTRSAR